MTTRTSGLTALACGILVAAALLACKKRREPLIFKATPQTAVAKYYTMTVNGATECDVGKKYLEPKKGFVYLGVRLTIEATTDETVGIFDHEFELTDGSGGSYKTSLGQCPPVFEDVRVLRKNEKLSGVMTFEVPETAGSLVFHNNTVISPSIGRDETSIALSR